MNRLNFLGDTVGRVWYILVDFEAPTKKKSMSDYEQKNAGRNQVISMNKAYGDAQLKAV
jgi:hypothetical protein